MNDSASSVPEVAVPTVQFPDGKLADVFPWTGNDPEDDLSEELVKGGLRIKPLLMNESNTGRPSVVYGIRNNSGSSELSSLFHAAQEKRKQIPSGNPGPIPTTAYST